MTKTVHVFWAADGWAVRRDGRKSGKIFATQKEAIVRARSIVRESAPSQMVVHGKDGMILDHVTHGLPRVQNPPRKSGRFNRIEKAVGRVALERVTSSDR
jgi:hypothetical protein